MKVLLVNDTSAFHCGSWAACEVILAGLAQAGHGVAAEADKTLVDVAALDHCDAVLVNGEGTLHDDSQRALRILALLEHAQARAMPTAICNASWFGMTTAYDHVLRRLDAFEVREGLSWRVLRDTHGITAARTLDLSYFHPARAAGGWPPANVRMTDLYWPAIRGFAAPTGGQLSKFECLRMDQLSWQQMLDATGASELLLTGRHHGVYAACRARTPFVALSGNTPKIEGLAEWSGIELPVTGDPAQLASLVATRQRHRGACLALFDWMEAMPAWKSPW